MDTASVGSLQMIKTGSRFLIGPSYGKFPAETSKKWATMGCKVGCIARSGGKLFDSPGLFPARYGLAISGTRFED